MKAIIFGFLLHLISSRCIHGEALKGHVISVYTPPESERRLLQETVNGPLRVHIENVDVDPLPPAVMDLEWNILNVAKAFYESFLEVEQVEEIVFPSDSTTCNFSLDSRQRAQNPNKIYRKASRVQGNCKG